MWRRGRKIGDEKKADTGVVLPAALNPGSFLLKNGFPGVLRRSTHTTTNQGRTWIAMFCFVLFCFTKERKNYQYLSVDLSKYLGRSALLVPAEP